MSPEPDVLERGKVYFDEHFTEEGPIPRELCSDVERLLADAIAEIKRFRGELMALVHCGFCGETWTEEHRWCDPELAQLRAITDAEPMAWAWTDPGHRDWYCRKGYPHDIARREGATIVPLYAHMARALAVVAPKGDTEE